MRREQLPVVAVVALGVAVALALVVLVFKVGRAAPPIAASGGAPVVAAEPAPPEPSDDEAPEPPPALPSADPPATEPSSAAVDEPPDDERGAVRRPVGSWRGVLGREGGIGDARGAARSAMATTMQAANAAYDRQDYEGAAGSALEVLAREPDNVRMLRVVVSASCALEDEAKARQYYAKLPAKDQASMARRCGKFGVTF